MAHCIEKQTVVFHFAFGLHLAVRYAADESCQLEVSLRKPLRTICGRACGTRSTGKPPQFVLACGPDVWDFSHDFCIKVEIRLARANSCKYLLLWPSGVPRVWPTGVHSRLGIQHAENDTTGAKTSFATSCQLMLASACKHAVACHGFIIYIYTYILIYLAMYNAI